MNETVFTYLIVMLNQRQTSAPREIENTSSSFQYSVKIRSTLQLNSYIHVLLIITIGHYPCYFRFTIILVPNTLPGIFTFVLASYNMRNTKEFYTCIIV